MEDVYVLIINITLELEAIFYLNSGDFGVHQSAYFFWDSISKVFNSGVNKTADLKFQVNIYACVHTVSKSNGNSNRKKV
jgi:hypothetical protein